ncbi:hypothetical protein [Rhizosphaericola mali]|uniref:Uncharacterized protein n=1 Tax=Rhizosphaericola mali TaxID=2545455 RepID=A0A5P2G598_9BACT|nr:hypothetical protein [Rhizosphaericola mali]QES88930.1 hypothetical protein E0W69_009760 [Rhizosphaericola mali]
MSKLAKEMENWRQAEIRHANVFGKAAIRTKGYQKIRLAEMQRIYRGYRGVKLSLDDRVRLRLLRSGNRHLEKQLYPNRWVRYVRRMVRFSERTIKNGFNQIKRRIDNSSYLPKENMTVKKPMGIIKPALQNKVDPPRLARLPRKEIKQVETMEQRRGRSL